MGVQLLVLWPFCICKCARGGIHGGMKERGISSVGINYLRGTLVGDAEKTPQQIQIGNLNTYLQALDLKDTASHEFI